LFWADKAATLSHFDPRDVYQLASCMFLLKQYQRAVILIKNKGLDKVRIIELQNIIKIRMQILLFIIIII